MIELDVLSAADAAADEDAQAAAGQAPTWRSRTGPPAGPDREFLDPVTEADAGTSRRSFLKVMGASAALAGMTGCRRPVETILPYARKPEDVIPGVPSYYATAMPLGGVGHALLVQSHEGRPTKAEGNPEHPISGGSTDIFAQASVLQLYDPDRSRHVWTRGEAAPARADWGSFVAEAARLRLQGGAIAVLAEPSASPTADALRDRFLAATPGARWITLGPHLDDAQALGTQSALGQPARPLYRFQDADIIVSFDADFIGADDPNTVWNNRQYAASRRVDERGSMSRLYVVESTMTTTGGMADHRRAVKAGAVPFVAAAIAQGLGVSTGVAARLDEAMQPFVDAIVTDVRAAGGRAAFVAGMTQPAEVHALAAALNGQFGGGAVEYLATGAGPVEPVGPQLAALVRDMAAGRVETLLMLGTNPVYSLPAELGFEEALARVPTSIHVGLYRDETGQRATWHLPRAHYLESWGDARAYDGTLSIVQPLIAPLYPDAHSDLEVLNTLATGRNNAGYDLLRQSLRGTLAGDFETAWRTALHDGFVAGTRFASLGSGGGAADLSGLRPPADDALELVIRTSPTLYDGQFSNVAWMQEAPHPVTKVTWDPVALVSPRTAVALGVDDGDRFSAIALGRADADLSEGGGDDAFEGTALTKGKNLTSVVRLTTAGGVPVELPVWVQPGHPDGSVTAFLGYGRDLATDRPVEDMNVFGRVNRWLRPGSVDTDVYRMGTLAALVGADLSEGAPSARVERCRTLAGGPLTVAVEAVAGDYLLASTQDHGTMQGRAIVRSATVEEYTAEPDFAKIKDHYVEDTPWENFDPLWGEENSASDDPRIGEWIYSDNQWGMTIDLNACTGCNACVVACQSENNVPVVGKDQVARGREMHWLRLDRYYVGTDESDPGMVTQPMMCVHCENAPCEQVCPVNATAHSPDGLNEMTYNRCIGTRYCANNCPYKVRRYNFYNWTKTLPTEVQMQSNPYVTVRYRGVMEKCTFCVQRIRQTQQYAHIEDRELQDGEVVTACQQACPADAIVFGDLRDRTSAVSRSKESPRNYAVLAELAVKPRLTYLARLRNPHPGLATPYDTVIDAHAAGDHPAADA
ncbi:4Fe-4S dicluster domain-containing protein [Rubrivirga sp.]|uniref:4Fe-4S dicluster domain-containing protein n=1 Tax=Rubrivirga sp. TaxID=1885344 RepID=UPI003B5212D6